MEQSDTRKYHCHSVFVCSFNNQVISYRTARLCDILHAALCCSVDVVEEWEESVGAAGYVLHTV